MLDAATVPVVLILLPDSVTPPTVVLLILLAPVIAPFVKFTTPRL